MNNQIRFASGLMTGSTEKKAETEKRLTSAKGTRLYRVFMSASHQDFSFAYLPSATASALSLYS